MAPRTSPEKPPPKEVIVEGAVFLNLALARSPLKSYDPDLVVSYLTENLHWRVMQVRGVGSIVIHDVPPPSFFLTTDLSFIKRGEEVDFTTRLPSLQVSVVEVPIIYGPGDGAPRRNGAPIRHPSVTAGRPGGADN